MKFLDFSKFVVLDKFEEKFFREKLQKELNKKFQEESQKNIQERKKLSDFIMENQENIYKLKILVQNDWKDTILSEHISLNLSEVNKLTKMQEKLQAKKDNLESHLGVLKEKSGLIIREEEKVLKVWSFLYEKSSAEMESIREELNDLGRYWEVFKWVKKFRTNIHKVKSELKLLKGLSPAEKEKVLEYFAAKTQVKGKLKQGLRNMKSFKDKTNKEMDRDMRILYRLLKSTPEQLQEHLFDLMERERDNLELIVEGLKKINSLKEFQEDVKSPKLREELSSFETWVKTQKEKSPEEERRLNDVLVIGSELIRLNFSPSIVNIRDALFKTFLKNKSSTEIKEEVSKLGTDELKVSNQLKKLQSTISALNKKTVSQMESELENCQINLDELENKKKESEEEEQALKNKTKEDLSKDIDNLESLRMSFIYQNENQIEDIEILQKWDLLKNKAIQKREKDIYRRIAANSLVARSRNSIGMKGIKLEDNDRIVSVSSTYEGELALAINETGKAKCIEIEDFAFTGRNAKGRCPARLRGNFGKLLVCSLINKDEDEILFLTEKGYLKRLPGHKIKDSKSGVIELGKEKEKDKLISFVKHKSIKSTVNGEMMDHLGDGVCEFIADENIEDQDDSDEESLENEVETM